MKLIHVTDTHFVKPGETLYDTDPSARLDAAIADINAHHADAGLCVITGDLTHWGEAEAYENLKESLSALRLPLRLVLGNHDDRPIFRQFFPDTPVDDNGFIQSSLDTPAGRLLFLDTNEPDTHAGHFCPQRLRWLEQQLTAAGDMPLFLFMHHPPFPVHLKPLDSIGLMESAEFRAVVAPHAAKIRHLFYGHVHRPIAGSWLGIPCSTIRGTNHQVWLDFDATETIPASQEPPAYAVALIDQDSVVVHFHDYLDASKKYDLGSTRYADWSRENTAAE